MPKKRRKAAKKLGKVLLVEDDQLLVRALKIKLTSDGFEVFSASDGSSGLETLKKVSPDVVILDIMLPGWSGIDFLKIVNRSEHPKMKIIAFTNLSNDEVKKKALELGVDEHLIKAEVSLKQLSDSIERQILNSGREKK